MAMTLINLRDYPKVAEEIGFLAMLTSNLGILLVPILTAVLDGDAVTAQAVCIKIENLTAKLDILFEVASHKAKTDPLCAEIMRGKKDIQKAVSYRNKLAHSLYVIDQKTGHLELFDGVITERRGKPRAEHLKADDILKSCTLLQDAVMRIVNEGGIASKIRSTRRSPALLITMVCRVLPGQLTTALNGRTVWRLRKGKAAQAIRPSLGPRRREGTAKRRWRAMAGAHASETRAG